MEGVSQNTIQAESGMTWTSTLVYLALWIGVCLVLFYGSWPVIFGAVGIAMIADRLYVDRINKARAEGFDLGKQSVKPIVVSEQVGCKPTFCYADGRVVRVGRDC